jgi:tRNA threonylcarbamoyladenosine biosynthesis protein TsaB
MMSLPRLLAFDTSTESMSVAVRHGDAVLERSSPGGAQASATLIPLIQALLSEAGLSLRELDAIAFGRGPGSFTGLRTACSVAQGLGFGAGVPLLPVDTLQAVAEDARQRLGAQQVLAVLDARMDQVYSAAYDFGAAGPAAAAEPQLLAPEQVIVPPGFVLAGNAFDAYGERLPAAAARHPALPTAAAMLRLAPALLSAGRIVAPADAWPLYVRDKVAQTTAERAAAKQASTQSQQT